MTTSEILIAEAIYYQGNWEEIVRAIRQKELLPTSDIIRMNRELKCKAITILDKEYPTYLKELYRPPLVLFYYGDISLINDPNNNLAIVGTRKPSELGTKITREITETVSKKYNIVSGLALGIDAIAHEEAIKNGGKTVAILGCGIDICYPSSNRDIYEIIKKDHLLISEYPNQTTPSPCKFPNRNRLIAQFSKGILVTESKKKSGTSITVNYGLWYGRDIMCVPSVDFNDSGCNKFIREGAALVENAEQVLEIIE